MATIIRNGQSRNNLRLFTTRICINERPRTSATSQATQRILSSIIRLSSSHRAFLNDRQSCRLQSIVSSKRRFHTSRKSASSKAFSYRIAASFTAKDRPYNASTNTFTFNPQSAARRGPEDKSKRFDSGQDAFFVSRLGKTDDVAFGIADGVGGWADSGVDPADFSHGICSYMAHAASEDSSDGDIPQLTARGLMQRGYDDISEDKSVPAGSSTACVAIGRKDGSMEIANLGDSGYVQLRMNAVHNYSEPQTHAFNAPYQLAIVPPKLRARRSVFGGSHFSDYPGDANVTKHSLRHGDVLVFATDGVWDNLSPQDTLRIVSRLMIGARAWEHTRDGIRIGSSLNHFTLPDDGSSGADEIPALQTFLAVGIAGEAKAASVNTKVDGPFARGVQRHYPDENWHGGKVDDICVLVVVVVEEGK